MEFACLSFNRESYLFHTIPHMLISCAFAHYLETHACPLAARKFSSLLKRIVVLD